jgi:hypothetical protein
MLVVCYITKWGIGNEIADCVEHMGVQLTTLLQRFNPGHASLPVVVNQENLLKVCQMMGIG